MSIFIGQPLRLELTALDNDGVVDDLSATTSISIKIKPPQGSTATKVGTFTTDGTDGKVYYDILSGELTASGTWSAQLIATYADGDYPSTIVTFAVEKGL